MKNYFKNYLKYSSRILNFGAMVLASFFVMGVIETPRILADQTLSSVATAALFLASFNAGWLFYDEEDRTSAIGFSVGLPLGFFYHQNAFGVRANMSELSTGSSYIMGTAATIAIVALFMAWLFKYRVKKEK